ncbi:hypothetical protein E3P99_03956 [Wallemia hederae]|uniref:DUF4042 domain-containing protein n=1 Tax=Wallemia hederae TaxID=1540922 RepID=A0A4T0FEL7_9BASI|nr:hypothetical protein E3P99_03956 [Wallemia hederae]
MRTDAEILQSAEAVIDHRSALSVHHLDEFQKLLRDDLKGVAQLEPQHRSTLLRAINSLLSHNIQGDEELLDICLSFASPGHTFGTRKKALKVLVQLYSKKPKKEISARTSQIVGCLAGIPRHATSLLSLALHSLLVAMTKLALTAQHVQSFVELFMSNILVLVQSEDKSVRKSASISSFRSVISENSAEISHDWRSRRDSVSDAEEGEHSSASDATSDVILQACMCLSQLAKMHIKFVFNHIFKLFPDTSPTYSSPLTLWDILRSDMPDIRAKLSAIQCIQDTLHFARPFFVSSAEMTQKSISYTSLSYTLGALLMESHNATASFLRTHTDEQYQVALLGLAGCLFSVTPYAKMASGTSQKLCAQLREVVSSLSSQGEHVRRSALQVLREMVDAGICKDDIVYCRDISSYLLYEIDHSVFTSKEQSIAIDLIASMWTYLPGPERKESVTVLFGKLFEQNNVEATRCSLKLLALHSDVAADQDTSILYTSHQLSKVDVNFHLTFLELLAALVAEQNVTDETLFSILDWVLEGVLAQIESVKLSALSAARSALGNARIRSNTAYTQGLEEALVECLNDSSSAIKHRAGLALADYLDAIQLHEIDEAKWRMLFDMTLRMEVKEKGKVGTALLRDLITYDAKVQVHVIRAYGSILEKCQGMDEDAIQRAKRMLLLLKDELKPQLNYKIQWNAATAIAKAYTSEEIYKECSSVTAEVLQGLVECESKSRNMKVSEQASSLKAND